MSRQLIWQEIYNRFDPFLPAAEQSWRADRPRSPAGDIVKLLGAPFDGTRVLVTGTTGTGKSTELLRIAEASGRDDFVVVLDLQRHFSEIVGDEQALQSIHSWEVVFLAGLAVVRAATELMPYAIPKEHQSMGKSSGRIILFMRARCTSLPAASPDKARTRKPKSSLVAHCQSMRRSTAVKRLPMPRRSTSSR